ncbi:MAG: protein-L-isoaspartate O-methyltransferase [Gammaproteobacteria bacterium]|nr:protein-L-isoaspartate O-methyltransferase [Gammaproteobacteria bacterium]
MNLEEARFNMIEQQIRPWEVLDQTVLDLVARTRREDYVPETYRTLAFADVAIPLSQGETMLAPKLEARLLQAVAIQPQALVLEVGTGSGYFTALLAQLARHVISVDIHAELVATARQKLSQHGIVNVTLVQGDAARGWDKQAPYDGIIITGSLPVLPESFKTQLKVGGRLCAIIGDSPVMTVRLFTRLGPQQWQSEDLFETDVPPLKNALQPNRFVL